MPSRARASAARETSLEAANVRSSSRLATQEHGEREEIAGISASMSWKGNRFHEASPEA